PNLNLSYVAAAPPPPPPPPPPPCPATPLAGCRKPAAPGRALLRLKDRTPDTLDALLWKWAGGAATTKADFGDPVATTTYQLCLYDHSGSQPTLRLTANAPAGGTCGARPCWTGTATGFLYADPALTPDGLATISARVAGAGAAKLVIKGKGTNLPLSGVPLGPPVTVQLSAGSGMCWEAVYTTPLTNTGASFKAKSD